MAPTIFNFSALAEFDAGRIREAVDLEIARCRLDCEDRPGLDKPRKVTLTITLTPEPDESGRLQDVEVDFQIAGVLPKRSSRPYNMKAKRGTLLFNDLSPDDADQMTLDQLGPQEAVHAG